MDKQIQTFISRLRRRLGLKKAAEIFPVFLSVGFFVAFVHVLFGYFYPFYYAGTVGFVWIFASLCMACLFFILKFPKEQEAAHTGDGVIGGDRLLTALELRGNDSAISCLQKEDTLSHILVCNLKQSFPCHFSVKHCSLLFLAVFLFLFFYFLPSDAKSEALRLHEVKKLAREESLVIDELLEELEKEKELDEQNAQGAAEGTAAPETDGGKLAAHHKFDKTAKLLNNSKEELLSVSSERDLERAKLRLQSSLSSLAQQAYTQEEQDAYNSLLERAGFSSNNSGQSGSEKTGDNSSENSLDGSGNNDGKNSGNASSGNNNSDNNSNGNNASDGNNNSNNNSTGNGNSNTSDNNHSGSSGGAQQSGNGQSGSSQNGQNSSGNGNPSGNSGNSGNNSNNGNSSGSQNGNSGNSNGNSGGNQNGSSGSSNGNNGGNQNGNSGSSNGNNDGNQNGNSGSSNGNNGGNQNGNSGNKNENNSGNGNGGSGSGGGTGSNYGSKKGIERKSETKKSPEQIMVMNEALGNDEALTGTASENGGSYTQSSNDSLNFGSKKNFDDVISNYTDDAYTALKNNQIPSSMEHIVREYFTDLN